MEEQEKQLQKRNAGLCAMAALGYPLVLYLVQGVLSLYLSLRVPGATLENPAGLSMGQTAVLLILSGTAAMLIPSLFAVSAGRLSFQQMGWRLPPRGTLIQWMPLFLTISAWGSVAGNMLSRKVGAPISSNALPVGGSALLMYFIAMCIVPAICEELFFRGVLRGLLARINPRAAVWGSALLFSLMHGSLAQCLTALICGLVLGRCAQLTSSLMPCILMHLANNTMAFISLYLRQYGNDRFFNIALMILMPVWMLIERRRHPLKMKRLPKGSGSLLRSPAYWIAAAGLAVHCILRSMGLL